MIAIALAEGFDALLVGREFARRQHAELAHLLFAALSFRIEAADRLDLIVEQLDAVRVRGAHRKQVEQGAAPGKFALRLHFRYRLVDGGAQLSAKTLSNEPVSAPVVEPAPTQPPSRSPSLHHMVGGRT